MLFFFHVVFCFCRMFLVGGMSHENLDVFFLMFFFFWEDFTSSLNGDILGIFNNNSNGDVEGDGERERLWIYIADHRST